MIEFDSVEVGANSGAAILRLSARLQSGTTTVLGGAPATNAALIRAIAGVEAYAGSIRFDGRDAREVRSGLYVCFDPAPVVPYLSGFENIRLLSGRKISFDAAAAIAPGIAGRVLLHSRAGSMGVGQRRRLHLAAALVSRASYLVFENATSASDGPSVETVCDAIAGRSPNATVLLTADSGTIGSLIDSPVPAARVRLLRTHLLQADVLQADHPDDRLSAPRP